jgi:pimeloyl-ACP methyl ester carboxylesterase
MAPNTPPRWRQVRRTLTALAAIGAAALLGLRAATPEVPPPEPAFVPPPSLAVLEARLAATEARFADLRTDAARTVVWADPVRRHRTPVALVYLHGFSASRQEIAPAAERAAAALGANLYYARIPGHGRSSDAMAESSLPGWQAEGESAVAVGRLLGEQVVLIGTSTGGTLVTWLAARYPDLAGAVLVSPNFGVREVAAPLAALPGGQALVRLVVGPYRQFRTHSALHARHWTWRYSTMAIPPMMQLVRASANLDLGAIRVPLLAFYSPTDTVVRPDAIEAAVGRWGTDRKRLLAIATDDPSRHILAGDALSPATTSTVVAGIVAFVRGLPRPAPAPTAAAAQARPSRARRS